MNDRDFLIWIHDRLINVHGENENADFMWRLRAIAMGTLPDKVSPSILDGLRLPATPQTAKEGE